MKSRIDRRQMFATSTALAAIMAMAQAGAAQAQAATDTGGPLQEVVVTASRVERAGFTAPTPTTVLGVQALEQRAVTNVADALNELPSFRPTQTQSTSTLSAVGGQGQIADLRGLSARAVAPQAPRTLVLVDRQRFVPSGAGGNVDLNLIPTIAISRADVVTGGASATYGSDAVAGVVNFITNHTFNGLKTDMSAGITQEGDGGELRFGLLAGSRLNGDRGHVTFAGEYIVQNAVEPAHYSRDWGANNYGNVAVPAASQGPLGLQGHLIEKNVQTCNEPAGGVIAGANAGAGQPLRGIAFGPGGSVVPFNYGLQLGTSSIGGCQTNFSGFTPYLFSPDHRFSSLANLDYKLTDSINLSVQGNVSRSAVRTYPVGRRDTNTSTSGTDINSILIKRDNPYIPASVAAIMDARGITQFNLNRGGDDVGGRPNATGVSNLLRFTAGLDGDLGHGWKWNTYVEYGQNSFEQLYRNAQLVPQFLQAIDAVRNSAGQIVCRVNQTTVTQPGCLPLNVLGYGVADPKAVANTLGTNMLDQTYTQKAAAATITGDLGSTWAGAISLAGGLEYRSESLVQAVDSNSQLGNYKYGNNQPYSSSDNVKEAFAEAVVPLLKDQPFGKSFDVDLAARRTDYNLSGAVTTWKAGATYDINDIVRLRATRSRDIRAPTLNELNGYTTQTLNGTNPYTNGLVVALGPTQGNPNLKPEVANTWTAGVVVQPEGIFRGLRASVDYYNIDIDDAISTFSAQTILNNCRTELDSNAQKFFCNYVTYTGAPGATFNPTQVITTPLNIARSTAKGWDFEVDYRFPLVGGRMDVRALLSLLSDRKDYTPSGPQQNAGFLTGGNGGVPKLMGTLTTTYAVDKLQLSLLTRYIGKTHINNTFIGPDQFGYNPLAANSANVNSIGSVMYFDLSGQYDLVRDSGGRSVQIYGVINNLLNRDPPVAIQTIVSGGNPYVYDVLGRAFKVGVRLTF